MQQVKVENFHVSEFEAPDIKGFVIDDQNRLWLSSSNGTQLSIIPKTDIGLIIEKESGFLIFPRILCRFTKNPTEILSLEVNRAYFILIRIK